MLSKKKKDHIKQFVAGRKLVDGCYEEASKDASRISVQVSIEG